MGDVIFEQDLFNIIVNLDLKNDDLFKSFIAGLNGNYSIILSNHDKTLIAADRMRMFPVVYFMQNEKIVITDNIDKYRKTNTTHFTINETTLEQYFFSDYVFGPFTIYQDVFSIQSGELVTINHSKKTFIRQQYFHWLPHMFNDSFKRNLEDEAHQQDKIFLNVFTRMLKSAPNVNNWIIPLSGGYDSRTIVNYLFKLGVKNVICFSYGMKGNIQSEISKQIAEALGYQWFFIDYKEWIKKIHETSHINEFLAHAFNGTSVAHLQDFTAVFALKQMKIIEENDIFVPGHALEVLAGNHLNPNMQDCQNLNDVLPTISHHFSGFGYSDQKRVRVNEHVKRIIEKYNIHPTQVAEYFDWQERQTKFIAYSVMAYEYFGFNWRIPEWDLELFNYWETIGFNYRINRNMFKEIFKARLNVKEISSIPIANEVFINGNKSLQAKIIDSIPLIVKKLVKKLGYKKTNYYVNEGLHLVHSNNSESILDYIKSYPIPEKIKTNLKKYPKRQKLSSLPVNSVSTLINIRNSICL